MWTRASWIKASWIIAPALALSLAGCDVEQTEEGDMPEVDVRGGNLPEYDVDVPDVDVGTERRTIEVPDVDVNMQEREVEVPTIDINPDADEPGDADRTAPAPEGGMNQ